MLRKFNVFLKIIFFFFFIKKNFKKISHKKILIYDRHSIPFLKKIVDLKKCEILSTRFVINHSANKNLNESINLRILLRCFFKFKFTRKYYVEEYINFLKPKIVITAVDNDLFFYQLKKKFNTTIFISIQTSLRSALNDLFSNIHNLILNHSKCDYSFVYNDYIGKFYKKFLGTTAISIGSIRSNCERIINQKKKISLLYVSTYKGLKNNLLFIDKKKIIPFYKEAKTIKENLYRSDIIKNEIKLLKNLNKFLKLNNKLSLTILGCRDNKLEKKFYENILINTKFNFISRTENRNTYKIIDDSEVIINIDSSIGYESIARGSKVAFFSIRGLSYPFNTSFFCWPRKIKKKGYFWTHAFSFNELNRVLKNTLNISNANYKLKIKKSFKGLLKYNYNNVRIKNFIDQKIQ
jgi:surface carbohydrate biosynthesis protein